MHRTPALTMRTGIAPRATAGDVRAAVEPQVPDAYLDGEVITSPWYDPDDGLPVLEHKRFSELEEQILLGGGGPTKAGITVNAHVALQIACVFACLRVISEDIAKMPRHLMVTETKDDRQRRRKATEHPLYQVLSSRPNAWMTGFEFVEYMTMVAALEGEAYACVVRGTSGDVLELLPFCPGAVRAHQASDWSVQYWLSGYGEMRPLHPREVFRLAGPLKDAVAPFRPVHLAREALGLASAIEASQARFHANDLRPAGILTTEDKLAPDVRAQIKQDWQEAYGPGGRGGIAVLDKKFDFKAMTVDGAKNEVVDNRKFQIEEICRFFRVNPQKVMHPTQAQGYSSVEQFNISHVTDTLMPWVTRWEQACERDLLDAHNDRDKNHYVKFNVNALMRGTLADRASAYEKAVKIWLTPNEIRALEDLDELDDPAADRVQFLANNTGLRPAEPGAKPAGGKPASEPKPEQETA